MDILETEFAPTLVAHELEQVGSRGEVGCGQFLVGVGRETVATQQVE